MSPPPRSWHALAPEELERAVPRPPMLSRLAGEDGPYRSLAVIDARRVVLAGPDGMRLLDLPTGTVRGRVLASVVSVSAAPDGTVWAVAEGGGRLPRVVRWAQPDRPPDVWAPERDTDSRVSAVVALSGSRAIAIIAGLPHLLIAPRTPARRLELRALADVGGLPGAVYDLRQRADDELWWLSGCASVTGPPGGKVTVYRGCAAYRFRITGGRGGRDAVIEERPGIDALALGSGGQIAAVTADSVERLGDRADPPVPRPSGARGEPLLIGSESDGSLWLVGQQTRRCWSWNGASWQDAPSLPFEIGVPVAIAGIPGRAGVLVLGVQGLARIAGQNPASTIHHASPFENLSGASMFVPLLLVFGTGVLALGGAIGMLVWRRSSEATPWSIFDAGVAVLLFIGGQMLVLIAWGLAAGIRQPSTPLIALSYGAGGALSVAWIVRRLRRHGARLAGIGMTLDRPLVDSALGLALAVPGYLVAIAVSYLCRLARLPTFLYDQSSTAEILVSADLAGIAAAALLAVMIAPLTEELLFRGFLLETLARRLGTLGAVVVTSVAFGAIHVPGMLTTTALGLFFAAIVVRSGRLLPAIVAHAATNMFSLILLYGFVAR